MNIIEKLYYGNINPNAKAFDQNSEYGKFVKIIADNEEKLITYFDAIPTSTEEQHLFSQLISAQLEILSISELERFIEGFSLKEAFKLKKKQIF